ncbi:hypothetical protein PENTCL1PPCAC_10192, partial [Pristionchus entomophagus]
DRPNLRHCCSAIRKIFHSRWNCFLNYDVLDLHYMTERLALLRLQERIQGIMRGERRGILIVCTGVGKRSEDQGI